MGPQEQGAAGAAAAPSALPAEQQQQGQRQQQQRTAADAAAADAQLQQWYTLALRAVRQRTTSADAGAQMLREYQHVLALDATIVASTAVAKSRAAAGRNRYTNVLPFDHNRVVLGPGAPYLNASTVQLPIPGAAAPASYIATQGPLPGTVAEFWGMVAALRCPAVVMLTNVSEAGVAKCAPYLPPDSSSSAGRCRRPGGSGKVPGWDVQVERSLAFSPDCTLRMLRLTDTSSSSSSSSGGSHSVAHYHFHAWPDHGVPASSSGIRAVCRHLGAARGTGRPVVVHCSAGIGRTGTFIALDVLLQCLDAWCSTAGGGPPSRQQVEATLDVPALVHALRRQRAGMVQTLEQYGFITSALADELAVRVGEGGGGGKE